MLLPLLLLGGFLLLAKRASAAPALPEGIYRSSTTQPGARTLTWQTPGAAVDAMPSKTYHLTGETELLSPSDTVWMQNQLERQGSGDMRMSSLAIRPWGNKSVVDFDFTMRTPSTVRIGDTIAIGEDSPIHLKVIRITTTG